MPEFHLESGPDGVAAVTVDGTNVANWATVATVTAEAGKPPTLDLEISANVVVFHAEDGIVRAWVHPDAVKVLRALGWRSPHDREPSS